MLSTGIVLFWNALDERDPTTPRRALILVRQTRACLSRVWRRARG